MTSPSIRHLVLPLTLALGGLALLVAAAIGWLFLDRLDPAAPPRFEQLPPAVGTIAPTFLLRDIDGREFRLADHLGRKPLVIEFGSMTSLTCVLGQFDRKEALARDFASHADFLFVYCREAHPDQPYGSVKGANPSQTLTWLDRAERARAFRARHHVARRILIDGDGDDSAQARFGGRENMLVVIDPDGRIVHKQPIADHRELRRFLEDWPTTE